MTEIDKFLSLLSSEHGISQFLMLLPNAHEQTRLHFTEQVLWNELPRFVEDGSVQTIIDDGLLDFEDQVILGFNLLALSGGLRGAGEVWGNALEVGDWQNSGITRVHYTSLPNNLHILSQIPTLTSLFIGDRSAEQHNLDLQDLPALRHLQLFNLSAVRLSRLPRSIEMLELFNTNLIVDCDWGEFKELSDLRPAAGTESSPPAAILEYNKPSFVALPERQLAYDKRPEELEDVFVQLEKLTVAGKHPTLDEPLQAALDELGWRAYDHRVPQPQLYKFVENNETRVIAVRHHKALEFAFLFWTNTSSRTMILCEDLEYVQNYQKRFTSGKYQWTTVPLIPLPLEEYLLQYDATPELDDFLAPPPTAARMLNITYPWGSDFVYQVRSLLTRGLGLKEESDPATEGSDSWGLFFCNDEALMRQLRFLLELDEMAKSMTEWEWYDNPWRSMADVLLQTGAIVWLSTDWKHFEIEDDCLEAIGYKMATFENLVLQNCTTQPINSPKLASYRSPGLTLLSGDKQVWQVKQLLLSALKNP